MKLTKTEISCKIISILVEMPFNYQFRFWLQSKWHLTVKFVFDSSRKRIQHLIFILFWVESNFMTCLPFCFESKPHSTLVCRFVLSRKHIPLMFVISTRVNLSFNAWMPFCLQWKEKPSFIPICSKSRCLLLHFSPLAQTFACAFYYFTAKGTDECLRQLVRSLSGAEVRSNRHEQELAISSRENSWIFSTRYKKITQYLNLIIHHHFIYGRFSALNHNIEPPRQSVVNKTTF